MNPLSVIRDAWYFSSRNLLALALLCLPLIGLECALQRILDEALAHQVPPLYSVLLSLVVYPAYSAALILFMDARSRGETPRIGTLWLGAALQWPRLVLLATLTALLIMLGLSLFILPALWVMTRLAFAEYLLVLEGRAPLQAMRESYALTRGHSWPILACLAMVMLPVWGIDLWLTPRPDAAPREAATDILTGSLIGFVQLFASVALFRAYMLRRGAPGTSS